MSVGDISRRQANTREISDLFHFTAIHFLPERHSAMVLIGERSEPLSDKLGGEICIATRALVCIYKYIYMRMA